MPQNTVQVNFDTAFPGMNADSSDVGDNYLSRISGETTLQIPFGRVVVETLADDRLALSATTTTVTNTTKRLLLGILAYNPFNQIASQLGNVADANGNIGIQPSAPLRVKKRGKLWVPISENVNPNLAVRISLTTALGGIGAFRTTASGSSGTMDISNLAQWCGTYTAAQGYAKLDFDFLFSAQAGNLD